MFDINRYSGKWWEIGKIPFKYQIPCYYSSADYNINTSGTIDVINYCLDEKYNVIGYSQGTTRKVADMKFKLKFDKYVMGNSNIPYDTDEGDYNILYTDYDNISLVGSPDQFWVLSRSKKLESKYIDIIKKIAITNGYNLDTILINKNLIV